MPQATPDSKFPHSVWNGLTATTDDVSTSKSPDIAMGNRMRAEIRGIETTLLPYVIDMSIIHAYGKPSEVLAINASGTGFEWAPGGGNTLELINDNTGMLVIGNAVYIKTNGNVDKAQADTADTIEFLGLVADIVIPSMAGGSIQIDGLLTATTAEWDAVTGDSGGLMSGSIYYLDPNIAGRITKTVPTIANQYIVRVGLAMSTTTMNIQTTMPILL